MPIVSDKEQKTLDFLFQHERSFHLLGSGDPAALGAAVTVALCGHWEHQPPCRWPHHTDIIPGQQSLMAAVKFSCPPGDEQEVRRRIDAALSEGFLAGLDGPATRWALI